MEILHDSIRKALEVLNNGGIILYPTDTIWGIGCNAVNEQAVNRIYKLKQREDSKSMLILVDNENRLPSYMDEVPDAAWQLIDVADKPMTIIYPNAKNLAPNLLAEDKSVGIRIAKDEFCQKLIQQFKRPIVSTSANISGQNSPANFKEISQEIIDGVDYVVEWRQDDESKAQPSSIIKIGLGNQIQIIRK